MKQRFFLALWLFITMLLTPLGAWADREVNQLQFGKQTITVASGEVITFYDFKGADDIPSSSSSNSQSLTVFTPAESGKSIQITFEEIDIIPDMSSGSYPTYMKVYSGTPSDDGFTWATQTSEVKKDSPLPDGNVLVTRGGMTNSEAYTSTTPETYISEAADGSMAVGFIYVYAKKCKGWKATVKAVQLENMTVTGAGSSYEGVVASPSTKQNVSLANAYVTATGVMNPDNVTGIYFTMSKNDGVVNPTALKLYKGDTQVSATVAADGDAYKFTLNEAAADGTTTFTIKGDFLGTAAVGAKVQVEITKIATEVHPAGITPFTAGNSVTVENPAMVLMSSTPQTVTVGETPMQFYDEGGKDGKIIGTTSGQVTFLSGVSDKKVMVDISKLVVNNGSMYYQVLKFYNGTEVNSSNLIAEKRNGETGIVRSTADDGSLTVVLEGASQTYEYDGWEATVSLFTPQPMDFDGVTTSAASTETVAGGDADQDMLTITVDALNTEPAMKVTKMAFSAGTNYALATKAALYFGETKVGETNITAADFTINLSTPQELVEGSNVFTLKYTISDEALNDKKVSAALKSITALVNNAEKTETLTSPTAVERTVNNLVLSHLDQGTVTKTVNGSMAFETQKTNSYSSYCEAGTDDRINIFVPKNDGMVCQIDFTEFEVQYSSSSYGTKSTFKIYAGQGTTGELLWELNDNAQQSEGPGKTIRSTAADGSLTIVFNPKSSYSYYYKGFKATVSEYLSKDMQVTAAEATQASTADASIGAADQDLLSVNVKTEGNLNALSMSGMKLNLKNTEANITKVSVWQGEAKLGEAAAAANVMVTFNEAVTLAEGDNQFTVKADVSENAAENQTIDAKLVAVVVGGADVAATNGDPEGTRTLKNMLLMTAGNHGTLNLGLGKTIAVFDDGGLEGDGADGVEAVVTFAPTGEADCIKLTNGGISFAATAHLYIYKGAEVNDDNLIVDLSGSTAKFDPIISDASIDGGKITIKYVGAGSYIKPNFAITAEGYKKTNVAVTGITTEDLSVSKVLKGQTDTKMLKIAVEAKGELGSVDITSFNITGTDGAAVSGYHIYQTGTTTTFSANEAFNEKYTITNTGSYYFWITYDVKSDASEGQTASATLNSIVVNGATINVTEPASATINVASGMSGTKTVGEGGDYATIQGAVDAIAALGMEGPVTLKIKAGDYNEKVRIPYIMGMGSVNTLTLESESGQRDVKIYHNNYTTAGNSEDQHKKDYGVVTLYQANYVTLRNLEITTTDLNYKAVVMIKDESRHATIDNCYLHTGIYASTSGDGPALVGHTIIDEENRNNDFLTVKNCLLEGGKYGAYIGGTSTLALPKEIGAVIEGNTFKNNGRFMLYSYDELGAKIRNNTFIIDNSEVKLSNGAIDIVVRNEHSESTEITGNVFNLASANTVVAIYVRQMESTAAAPAIIANNVVNLASANASCCTFKLNGANMKNMNIANNTFRMTGTNGGAAFWASAALSDGYGNVNVVNNIIQNETNGYAVNLYNDANLSASKINFQNNIMYAAGSTFFRAASETTGDFATFVEKTGATGCINKQVTFASEDILMPANNLDGDLTTALSLSYVTIDVAGTERPATGISIGAYEYSAEDAVPVMLEGYPTVSIAASETAVSGTLSVKADAMGRAFVLVKKNNETAPTADEVVASGQKATISANAEASITMSGLEAETTYKAYIVLQSVRGTNGELTTKEFATSEQPVELMAVCTEPVTTIAEGSTADLKVMVADGKAPFTITWIDSMHETVGEPIETSDLGEEISLTITPERSGDYIVTVKDAQQKEVSDTCRVVLTGDAQVAEFENLYLEDDSYWAGPDWKGEQEESLYGPIEFQGSFVSGSYSFANNYIPDYSSWNGFAYANKTSAEYANLMADMCNSTVGGAHKGDNYAVFFDPGGFSPATVTVLNNPDGHVIPGFYITNAAYTVDAILHGDGNFNKNEKDGQGNYVYDSEGNVVGIEEFHQGDFLKLTITADNGEELEFMLADYTSDNEDDWYYVSDWQYVDLSSLGTVKELEFTMTASRTNSWGYTTPLYFCIDDFGAEKPVTVTIKENMDATTFSCDKALDFTGNADVKAYIAVRKNDASTSLVRVDKVPANTGIVVTGNPGTYNIDTTNEQVTLTDENLLVGTSETYTVTTEDVGYVYRFVYSKTTGKTGFQKAKAGQTVSANKAYLRLPVSSSKEFIGFDDMETTGIDMIENADNDNPSYNLNGQRVRNSYRGVIIQKGKKYIKK